MILIINIFPDLSIPKAKKKRKFFVLETGSSEKTGLEPALADLPLLEDEMFLPSCMIQYSAEQAPANR